MKYYFDVDALDIILLKLIKYFILIEYSSFKFNTSPYHVNIKLKCYKTSFIFVTCIMDSGGS